MSLSMFPGLWTYTKFPRDSASDLGTHAYGEAEEGIWWRVLDEQPCSFVPELAPTEPTVNYSVLL